MLILLAAAFAGSEVHVDASAPCTVTVGGETESIKARKDAKFKVDEGTVPITVGGWAGDLAIPNRVAAYLACDGTSVRLLRAESMGPPGAKLANTAMAVGASAAAINDAATATGEAMNDMDKAMSGEMPANGSSRTEITMDVGPNGVSSTTSRTTAGPNGVQHDSSATSVGPDGVSRTTRTGSLNANGASFEEQTRSASIRLPGKGGVVSLTPRGGGGAPGPAGVPNGPPPPAATAPAPAPAAAAAEEAPPPKELVYQVTSKVASGGVDVEIRDPVASEGEFKLNLKLQTQDAFVVLDRPGVKVETPEGMKGNDSEKVTVVPLGKAKGTTLVWPGDHRMREMRLHIGGVHRIPLDGAAIDVAAAPLANGTVSVGAAQCEVSKVKVSPKEARASFQCTTETDGVVIDTAALGVTVDGSRTANGEKKAGPELVWKGGKTKFDLVVPSPGKGDVLLDWTGAARVGTGSAVTFEAVPMRGIW